MPLLDSRSLLQQTVDRLATLIRAEQTVVVTMRSHAAYVTGALRELGYPRMLFQPEDRGTAAAVLLAAHWIRARDPKATVVVTPADHLVLEEADLIRHIEGVARFVREHPEWMVLLGAQPTEPETEYGWIEAGPPVGWTAEGPVYRILRLWENIPAIFSSCLSGRLGFGALGSPHCGTPAQCDRRRPGLLCALLSPGEEDPLRRNEALELGIDLESEHV